MVEVEGTEQTTKTKKKRPKLSHKHTDKGQQRCYSPPPWLIGIDRGYSTR